MALTVQLQLNPRAKPFVPTVKANKLQQHRLYRGKQEKGEAPVSKHQAQLGRVRWASRRGEGEPNLLARPKIQGQTGAEIGGQKFMYKKKKKKKKLARKKRRRGRAGGLAARRQASNDRDRARRRELVIATHNVRTMAVDGKHGVGRAAEVLDVYQEMGCDIIDPQETRPSGQSALLQAGHYVVYCSGESGGDGEGKKGQGGVGLAVHKSISRAEARPLKFTSDRLLKVTVELCGRARAVTFVVGCMHRQTLNLLGKRKLAGQPWKGS